MAQKILEMVDISKCFGSNYALRNVSIDLEQGEILAICGENGAGKSTLMKILSGSYSCSEYTGTILVNGEPKQFHVPADASAAGIEMIYQEISMHLDLSIAENIFLGRMPHKAGVIDWPALYENAETYMRMVGLQGSSREVLRYLSTSQQQMVAIARALSRDPKILVLDEPTSALTEPEVMQLMENLERLRKNGISCLYITHKMKEVTQIADRIAVLRDGACVGIHRKEDVTINQIVEEMVNKKMDGVYPKRETKIGDVILSVEHMSIQHPYSRGKEIVHDVSFTLRSGEILGIVGLVGAGRSELVGAMTGAIKAKSGTVTLRGKKLNRRSPAKSMQHGMVLLTEDRKCNGYVPSMSVAENISLASLSKISRMYFLSRGKELTFAKRFIADLSIRVDSALSNMMSLSGGNQQKVIFAKWLMTEPQVLLLDEPTRGIDVGAKNQIYSIMQSLVEQGKSIVMISSELPELVGMADRFLVLSEGRMVAEVSRENASEEYLMKLATS